MKLANSIGRQLLFTTARIEAQFPDGDGYGTAFIYNASRGGITIPVLVTNKHVVEDARDALIWFIEANNDEPKLGHSVSIKYSDFETHWTGHPDPEVDVTCMLLARELIKADAAGKRIFYKPIGCELCPTDQIVADLDAIEDITFIGYPNSLFDTTNLTPIVRRGITATPIELDYCGLPMFLVDASVFPGSSGSPVFVIQRNGFMENGQYRTGSQRILFVGIVAATELQEDEGRIIVSKRAPSVEFDQLLDLGAVFNWRAVEEAIDNICKKFAIDRDQTTLLEVDV